MKTSRKAAWRDVTVPARHPSFCQTVSISENSAPRDFFRNTAENLHFLVQVLKLVSNNSTSNDDTRRLNIVLIYVSEPDGSAVQSSISACPRMAPPYVQTTGHTTFYPPALRFAKPTQPAEDRQQSRIHAHAPTTSNRCSQGTTDPL